ncbi:MAG: hypothetical protein NWS64_03145, partial [Microbacteriaceae bacterium]|nr:hypothetical protein [Microbacteriaceae bacterium]
MHRILKSTFALVAAASLPLMSVAPASASSPDLSSFTFDCETNFGAFPYEIPLYAASVTVSFANCPVDYLLADYADTGFASTALVTIDSDGLAAIGTMTVTGEAPITVRDEEGFDFAYIGFVTPFDIPDPSGSQLADSSQALQPDAPSAVWGTSRQINAGDEIQIGGINQCEIIAGEHVYA